LLPRIYAGSNLERENVTGLILDFSHLESSCSCDKLWVALPLCRRRSPCFPKL
jgi:hypothetical protein